jgi:AraC-like DNA-binding protein
MIPLPVNLLAAQTRESVKDPRYYWDSRRRGKNQFSIFQYSWSGSGVFKEGGREVMVPPGHAILTTSVEASAYYYPPSGREPWVFGWMNFSGAEETCQWLRRNFGSVLSLSPSGPAVGLFRKITARYVECRFQDGFHSSELVFQFLMEVSRELTSSSLREKSPIQYARHYIDDHHQRPLNIKELAEKFGMSREHFSRQFTATIGHSPGMYLRERRLQTAELLLKQSTESIGAVSRLSGFASASHFCRAFRSKLGSSPQRYRDRS